MALTLAAFDLIVPPAGTRYVGLLSAAPDSYAGTYDELIDSSYERQPISSWDKVELAGNVAALANTGALVWDAIADDGVTATHWGLFDAVSAGNLLWSGPLLNPYGVEEPINCAIGESIQFNALALVLRGEP